MKIAIEIAPKHVVLVGSLAIAVVGGIIQDGSWNCLPCMLGKLAAAVIVGALWLLFFGPGQRYPKILAGTALITTAVSLVLIGFIAIGDLVPNPKFARQQQTRQVPSSSTQYFKDWTEYCQRRGFGQYSEKTRSCEN